MSRPLSLHSGVSTVAEIPAVGVIISQGTTKPTDADPGYAPGCIFIDVDSGAHYLNVGTLASANFDPIAAGAQVSAISDVDLTGVDTGTDMTAAQATAIETAIAAIIDALEAFGIAASS
jgi:hypothetical protein